MLKKILLFAFIALSLSSAFSQGIIVYKTDNSKDTCFAGIVDSITVYQDMVIHKKTGVKDSIKIIDINNVTFNATIKPAPALSSVSQVYAAKGSTDLTITLMGSNFYNSSVVKWNGNPLSTTYISSSQLHAVIPTANMASVTTASISVFTPFPGGGTSESSSFSVLNNIEGFETGSKNAYAASDVTLSSGIWNLSDALIGATTADVKNGTASSRVRNSGTMTMQFDLTNGAGIVTILHAKYGTTDAGSTWGLWYSTNQGANWIQSGSDISTTQALTFATASFNINISGNIRFEIRKSDGTVNRINFDDITLNPYTSSINPIPAISSISPSFKTAGNSGFTITVNGTNFVSSSEIKWGSTALTTTYVSPTKLTASVPAANISSAGSAEITVYSPSIGGGVSSVIPFTVFSNSNVLPILTSISPSSTTPGSSTFILTASGSGFTSGSIVKWNGTSLSTTYISATQLTASVPGTNVASTGTASVTIFNPAPGGGTSSEQIFTISASIPNPVPIIASISPSSTAVGSPTFTLAVNGSSFVSSSVVRWNGASLATTYVSATQLQALVPASNVTSTGASTITVFSPSVGGGTSSSLTFTIYSVSSNVNLTMGNPSGAVTDITYTTNYLLDKPQFCASYNKDRGIPNWTSWQLNSTWATGPAVRQDKFITDATLPASWYHVTTSDYSSTGFSRGHMCPSADRVITQADNDAVFVMTNMIPQTQANNGGPWEVLETYCRTLVGQGNVLYIVSGGSGAGGTGLNGYFTTIASGKVTVPSETWKVIMVLPAGTNDLSRVTTSTRCIAVRMNNDLGPFNSWTTYRVSVDNIEALTGYDFFSNVPVPIQAVIEAQVDAVVP